MFFRCNGNLSDEVNMKKFLKVGWKVAVLLVWFLISIVVFEILLNRGSTDYTKEITNPSLPVVTVRYDGHDINKMFGYVEERDFSLIRNGITPLSEDRALSLRIYEKNNNIKSVSYELRSVDNSRFIESQEIENLKSKDGSIDVRITLKDLILDDVEYMLKITVGMISGREAYYYARIINSKSLNFEEKIDYVYQFSECTFDRDTAEQEIAKYLESDKTGDNTNFSHINIHSSLDMVTWSGLETEKLTEPVCTIEEIDSKSAIMRLEYLLKAGTDDDMRTYMIDERYRFIKGSERMYLMDFDRYMNSLILSGEEIIYNDKLMLGICNDDYEESESIDGNTYAFVNENSLYAVNSSLNSFVSVYSSYDRQNLEDRTVNDSHGIKILNVDETGNVLFVVYGYFNNGSHEGLVGVNLFEYNAKINVIEEKIFVKYDKTFELLKKDVEKLAYLSGNGNFYLYLDRRVLKINLETLDTEIMADDITPNDIFVNESGNMAAWIKGTEDRIIKEINVLNTLEGKVFKIKSAAGEAIKPWGFMGEDFVYGKARLDDISKDYPQDGFFPMYEIDIVAKSESILKKYAEDNIYITDCKMNDNLITLTRQKKNEEGIFEDTSPDSIVNVRTEKDVRNEKEIVATENLKKIVQISMKNEMDRKKVKYLNPKLALFEGGRDTAYEPMDMKGYYVFCGSEATGCYDDITDAIAEANAGFGTVMDGSGQYIWKKESYRNTNQIMRISGTLADDETSSLETCIETVLDYNGYATNVKKYLSEGMDAAEILENNIPDSKSTVLVNCSDEALKYYLNRDIPVIVMADNNSLLLIGYNDSSQVWMNPQSGNVMKVSNDEADRFYDKYKRRFLVVQIRNS